MAQVSRACDRSGKRFSLYLDQKLSSYVSPAIPKTRVQEEKGLHFTLCPGFIDWYTPFVQRPPQDPRNVDEIYPSVPQALEALDREFRQNRARLTERAQQVSACVLSKLESDQTFIYISETDNFSHNVTIANRRYVSAVAGVLANLDLLTRVVSEQSTDSALVVTTDHGGDESPFQQERGNHETPANTQGNWPFLLTTYSGFSGKLVNQSATVFSDQVQGLVASLVSGLDLATHQDANLHFFRDDAFGLKYLRQFELKSKAYHQLLRAEIGESPDAVDTREEGFAFLESPFRDKDDAAEFAEIFEAVTSDSLEPARLQYRSNLMEYYYRKITYIREYTTLLEHKVYDSKLFAVSAVTVLLLCVYLGLAVHLVSGSAREYKRAEQYALVEARPGDSQPKKPQSQSQPQPQPAQRSSLLEFGSNQSKDFKLVVSEQILKHKTSVLAVAGYVLALVYSFFSLENDINLLCYYAVCLVCLLSSDSFQFFVHATVRTIVRKLGGTPTGSPTSDRRSPAVLFSSAGGKWLLALVGLLVCSPVLCRISVTFESVFYNYKSAWVQLSTYLLFGRVYYTFFVREYLAYRRSKPRHQPGRVERLLSALAVLCLHVCALSCALFDAVALKAFSFYNTPSTDTLRASFMLSLSLYFLSRIVHKLLILARVLDIR